MLLRMKRLMLSTSKTKHASRRNPCGSFRQVRVVGDGDPCLYDCDFSGQSSTGDVSPVLITCHFS